VSSCSVPDFGSKDTPQRMPALYVFDVVVPGRPHASSPSSAVSFFGARIRHLSVTSSRISLSPVSSGRAARQRAVTTGSRCEEGAARDPPHVRRRGHCFGFPQWMQPSRPAMTQHSVTKNAGTDRLGDERRMGRNVHVSRLIIGLIAHRRLLPSGMDERPVLGRRYARVPLAGWLHKDRDPSKPGWLVPPSRGPGQTKR
jgi:hypothetical protein